MRKLGTTTIIQQEDTDQRQSTSSLPSRQRVSHKLRDTSNTSNPYHNHNIILPPCPLYTTKSPTNLVNFDTNKPNSSRTKNKMMDHSTFGMSLLLDGIHHTSGGRARLDSIVLASSPPSPNSTSRSKEISNNLKETTTKNSRKESLDSFRSTSNSGSISHQHQDGTFSSTTFKETENSFSTTASDYQSPEKSTKKSSKLHKVKTRHPSKSIAMNLNDMIVEKKKTKIKRPVTSGPPESSTVIDDSNFCIQKITTTRIFNNKNSGRKEKENNLPPINKFLSQSQIMSNCNSNEKEDHLHNSCTNKNCTKCNTMAQKLKDQVHVAKTLQRQNGCLENIVTQKRNLVEQLTRQVRTLVRENQQLSKGTSKLSLESMLSLDCGTTIAKTPTTINVVGSNTSIPQNLDSLPENESCGDSETRKSVKERSASTTSTTKKSSPKKSDSAEKLEEAEQLLSSLSKKCDNIQNNFDQLKGENQEINKFLADLLYTLNARGYESVTDHDGNVIDLYRCKGETFLDLKGRDARLRTPAKRLAPQETLLKAVIGSQERIIQNLISQLEDHQKDHLLGNRLSLENLSGTESHRNAVLEGEVLTVLGLLEGACHRNSDVYVTLKEQHAFDSQVKAHSGLTMGNAIVEAILERCQKIVNQQHSTPPSLALGNSKSVRKSRENHLQNRTATPPFHPRFSNLEIMSRGMIYSDNHLLKGNHSHHHTFNTKGCTKSEMDNNTKALNLSPRGQIFPKLSSSPSVTRNHSHLPQLSRSNQNPFLSAIGSIRSPLIVTSGLTPRPPPPPRLKQNSTSEINRIVSSSPSNGTLGSSVQMGDKNVPCLADDRCPYCSRQFSSSTSLAEINAHMEMHMESFQG